MKLDIDKINFPISNRSMRLVDGLRDDGFYISLWVAYKLHVYVLNKQCTNRCVTALWDERVKYLKDTLRVYLIFKGVHDGVRPLEYMNRLLDVFNLNEDVLWQSFDFAEKHFEQEIDTAILINGISFIKNNLLIKNI